MKIKKKLCFILDESILAHHHGVRRYVLSLGVSAESQCDVTYILSRKSEGGVSSYYDIYFDDNYKKNNGFSGNNLIGSTRAEILDRIQSPDWGGVNSVSTPCMTFLGECLEDIFDCIIVAAPWVYHPGMRFPSAKKIYCIAYDAIPNLYALDRPWDVGLSNFALEHIFAYREFVCKYDGLIAISNVTKNQCCDVLFDRNAKVICAPPMLPPGYSEVSKTSPFVSKRNQIVLAAPFDLRKGLKNMPKAINASGVRSLAIFGGVRCELEQVQDFFRLLTIENVTWWSAVDFNMQVKIYSESKYLLFPSLNEGLGLPVLESYACGAAALVSNILPLRDLVSDGDFLDFPLIDRSENRVKKFEKTIKPSSFYKKFANERWGDAVACDFWGAIIC